MWNRKTTKRALTLTLAAMLLCVPLLGLAAPAVVAGDSAAPVTSSAPTVGESDAPEQTEPPTESTEPGTTPEPESCSCETKCAGDAPNGNCPVCAADASKCQGKEPEPAPPACDCKTKCAAGVVNTACPVCKDDPTGCTGQEPPACACSVKCAAGAVNTTCPVCKTDLTGCKGKEPTPPPKPAYTITIVAPTGWHTKTADVQIRVTDENGTGWKQVEAKIERGGSWIDLTDDFADRNRATVEITENCTVYVTVTDGDGKAHTKSRYIECFDRVAPTVKAGIDGRLLRVEAEDELSGIDAVFIDGERYSGLTNGTLDVRLRDLGDEYKQISIQAVDNAGNKSKTVQINNPNYEEPKANKNEDKPSSSCPDTSKPTTTPTPTPTPTTPPTTTAPLATTTPAPGSTTKPSTSNAGGISTTSGGKLTPTAGKEETPVEKEPGEPLSEGSGIVTRDLLYDKATNKQFITVQGRDGNTFYIIIDYDAPVNEEEEQYVTYFLNQVDEADLAALLEEGEPAACDCTEKCFPGAIRMDCPVCATNMAGCAGKAPKPVETPDPEPEKPEPKNGVGGILVLLLVLALAGGGAFYYLKFIKNKPKAKGSANLDDYDYGDGPEDEDYETEDGPPEIADGAEPEEGAEDEET